MVSSPVAFQCFTSASLMVVCAATEAVASRIARMVVFIRVSLLQRRGFQTGDEVDACHGLSRQAAIVGQEEVDVARGGAGQLNRVRPRDRAIAANSRVSLRCRQVERNHPERSPVKIPLIPSTISPS